MKVFTELQELDLYSPNKEYPIINRTLIYLLPCILGHSKVLLNKLGEYRFIAAGLYDEHRKDLFTDTTIGFLIDARKSKFNPKDIEDIPQIKSHYYYGELLYGDLHMLVLELPAKYKGAKKALLMSQYSLMYEDPDQVLKGKRKNDIITKLQDKARKVCLKDPLFIEELDMLVGDSLVSNNLIEDPGLELDEKIVLSQEIFNYEPK